MKSFTVSDSRKGRGEKATGMDFMWGGWFLGEGPEGDDGDLQKRAEVQIELYTEGLKLWQGG